MLSLSAALISGTVHRRTEAKEDQIIAFPLAVIGGGILTRHSDLLF